MEHNPNNPDYNNTSAYKKQNCKQPRTTNPRALQHAAKEKALKANTKKTAIKTSKKQQLAMIIPPGSKIQVLLRALKTALACAINLARTFPLICAKMDSSVRGVL
jgi:hypothetical protein